MDMCVCACVCVCVCVCVAVTAIRCTINTKTMILSHSSIIILSYKIAITLGVP